MLESTPCCSYPFILPCSYLFTYGSSIHSLRQLSTYSAIIYPLIHLAMFLSMHPFTQAYPHPSAYPPIFQFAHPSLHISHFIYHLSILTLIFPLIRPSLNPWVSMETFLPLQPDLKAARMSAPSSDFLQRLPSTSSHQLVRTSSHFLKRYFY